MTSNTHKFYRTGWVALACIAWALSLCAPCLAGETSPAARGREAVLRYALHTSELSSLDPHFSTGSQDDTYTDLVFNGLLRYKPGDARVIEPDLALELPRFKIVDHRQVWTIHLRKGVLFHDSPGLSAHEMTAQDVAFSLKKAGNPSTSADTGLYRDMAFDILDPYTLTITLDAPISPLFFFPRLTKWRGGAILSREAAGKERYAQFLLHPVGTGPFCFKAYHPGQWMEFVSNPGYFRGKPRLDGVSVYFIPDNLERETAFAEGRVDVIYGVGKPGWLERMETMPDSRVDVFGPGYTGLFHLNTTVRPLDDIRVRRAIIFAMDRDALMAGTSRRLITPVYSPMSPAFLPGGLQQETIERLRLDARTDLGAARKLLREAGCAGGFSLTVPVSEKRLYGEVYKALKHQLEPINIRLLLQPVSHARYHEMIRQNESPIVLYFSFRPDPDRYLRDFFYSAALDDRDLQSTNFSHFTGVDLLLDNAFSAIDPKRQIMLWEQAQIKILSEAIVFPLFDINQCVLRRTFVDYGHPLAATLAGYPQFDETTCLRKRNL